jgi:hypothetical protein
MQGPCTPTAEGDDLKSFQCGFESHHGHVTQGKPKTRLHLVEGDTPRVNIFVGNRLIGMLSFDWKNYHEDWDAVVDLLIENPYPPGLEKS